MSPYLMFGAIAVIGAVIAGRPRPSSASGRSVSDAPSTTEGQQNRNRGARRMKATRNFHPPFYGTTQRRLSSRLVQPVHIPTPIPQYP